MDILSIATNLIFTLVCYLFAFYVTYDQFKKYLKNEDTSSFKIKSYFLEKKNVYPDFSICYTMVNNSFYDESQFPYNITLLSELFSGLRQTNENSFAPQPTDTIENASTISRNWDGVFETIWEYRKLIIYKPKGDNEI